MSDSDAVREMFSGVDMDAPGASLEELRGQTQQEARAARSEAGKKATAHRKTHVPGVDPADDYDPDVCFVRATNAHDHSRAVSTPFPNDLAATIEKLVKLDLTPYASFGDFARDACVHRLEYWRTRAPELEGHISAATDIAYLEAEALTAKMETDFVEQLRVDLREAGRSGNLRRLTTLLEIGARRVGQLEEGSDAWRGLTDALGQYPV